MAPRRGPHPAERFADPVELYDLCHAWMDHPRRGAQLRERLLVHGLCPDGRVLEGACGTGLWLAPFAPHHSLAGFDLHAPSLQRARQRLPGARLFQADLADFRVEEPQDLVLLLLGCAAYLPSQALSGLARASFLTLRPGGLVALEPYISPEQFENGRPEQLIIDTPHLKLVRQVVPRRLTDPHNPSQEWIELEFHHLLSATNFGPRLITTRDRLYLRSPEIAEQAFLEAGFEYLGHEPGVLSDQRLAVFRRPASQSGEFSAEPR